MNERAGTRGVLALVLLSALAAGCSRDDEPKADPPIASSSGEVVRDWDAAKPEPASAVTGGGSLAAPTEGYGGIGSGASSGPSASGSAGVPASKTGPTPGPAASVPRRIGAGPLPRQVDRVDPMPVPMPVTAIEIPRGPAAPPPPMVDTARGRVAVAGAVPFTRVELRPSGGFPLTLTGEWEEELRGLAGVELWAGGRRTVDGALDVLQFVVLRVDGRAAIDGRLVARADSLIVETLAGSRHHFPNAPQTLREHVGSRVWITGDPAAGVTAYGVIGRKQ